jgi:hypothetical protein
MKNNTHMGDKNILFIAFLNKKHKLFRKNAALRSKNKNWSSQNNVSEWNDISTHRLLFQ